jgi:two-component sensor histidine kinase
MLAGMIRLQSAQLKDPHVLAICRDVQSRIKSLAHVHERLYLSSNLAAVDFAAYVDRMIDELAKSYRAEASRVRVIADVEGIGLNIGTSIPLGLIINELLINAFKHAFPGAREGTIHLSLRALPDGCFALDIRDDGIGLPAGFAVEKAESLGLQLIGMLAEQIDGIFEIIFGAGAHFRIIFKERMS